MKKGILIIKHRLGLISDNKIVGGSVGHLIT